MYKPKHARRKGGAERVVYVLGVTPPPPIDDSPREKEITLKNYKVYDLKL
jgi:hypothetical protein